MAKSDIWKNIEGLHNNSPFEDKSETDRFTTLSPALESFEGTNLADPPPFNGSVPPNTINLLPPMEKPGKRGWR
jgi:hypothetical protein